MNRRAPRGLVAIVICGVATSCAPQSTSPPLSDTAQAFSRLLSTANAKRDRIRQDLQKGESLPTVTTELEAAHETTDTVRLGIQEMTFPPAAALNVRQLTDALQNEEGVERSLANAAEQRLAPFDTADRSEAQRSLDDTGRESLHYSNRVRHDLGLPPAPHDVEQFPYLL